MDDTPVTRGRVVRPRASGRDPAAGLRSGARDVDRQFLALAVPALGALVAEPLFVLVDSAVVGRLGTAQLAWLALAGTVLVTLVGLFVFLAYATTATVARHIGAGDERGALATGVDGLWLPLLLGVVVAAVGWLLTPAVVQGRGVGRLVPLFTADDAVRRAATLALVVAGIALPLAGYVYVLDGVLIGSGDGRYLALAGLTTLVVYVPVVAGVWRWAPDGAAGLAWLRAGFAGAFMLARALTNGLRARRGRRLVLGTGRPGS